MSCRASRKLRHGSFVLEDFRFAFQLENEESKKVALFEAQPWPPGTYKMHDVTTHKLNVGGLIAN